VLVPVAEADREEVVAAAVKERKREIGRRENCMVSE
jgi:hypothetical protein